MRDSIPLTSTRSTYIVIFGLTFMVGAAWALNHAVFTLLRTEGWSAGALQLWEAAGGGIFLAAVSPFSWRSVCRYLVDPRAIANGVVGIALPGVLIMYVAPNLSQFEIALLCAFAPLLTASIAFRMGYERLLPLQYVGVGFGCLGILAVGAGNNFSMSCNIYLCVLGLLAAIGWGAQGVYLARVAVPVSEGRAFQSASAIWAGVIAYVVGVLTADDLVLHTFDPTILILPAMNALALYGYFLAVKKSNGSTATPLILSALSLFSIGWGYVVFQEMPGLTSFIGGALVLSGAVLVLVQPDAAIFQTIRAMAARRTQ